MELPSQQDNSEKRESPQCIPTIARLAAGATQPAGWACSFRQSSFERYTEGPPSCYICS
jgi:hypothetical protein